MESEQNQNLNTTPPSAPQQPVVEPEKSSFLSSKWLKIGIGVLLVILILSGTFILGKNSMNKNQAATTVAPTETETPTPDLTANWKTYTSPKNTFSLKAPNLWVTDYAANEEMNLFGDVECLYLREKLIVISACYRPQKLSETVFDKVPESSSAIKKTVNGYTAYFEPDENTYYVLREDGTFILLKRGVTLDEKKFETVVSTFKFTNSSAESAQSFLEIPEYGVKFALTDDIKDAYYLPSTADKGYVYLKVHSLDLEPQCAKDDSSTAALSKVGKDDINEMSGAKYSDAGNGVIIRNYYYYIDLAQYVCAETTDGKANLEKVRKAFTDASKTIQKL